MLVVGIVLISLGDSTEEEPSFEKAQKPQKKEVDLGQDTLMFQTEKRMIKEDQEYTKTARISQKTQAAKKVKEANFEENFGKWLPKIGVISIVLGVAFFVVYAIQNKWIGPTGQVALGVLAGIALIITGQVFEKKDYYNYGMTLIGRGFAIIYFAMFSAYRFYSLVSLPVDVIALSIIIAAAVFFSTKYDSKIIAAEAFFLGYIVPLLTSHVTTFFLIYSAILTAGLSLLSYIKKWKMLGLGGIVAMYITHSFWLAQYSGNNKDMIHLVFIFIYLIMFVALLLGIKEEQKQKNSPDFALKVGHVISIVFLISYVMLFFVDFSRPLFILLPLLLISLAACMIALRSGFGFIALVAIIMTYILHLSWILHSRVFSHAIHLTFLGAFLVMFYLFSMRLEFGKGSLFSQDKLLAGILIVTYLMLLPLDFSKMLFIVIPLIVLLIFNAFIVLRYGWDYFTLIGILATYLIHLRWLSENFNDYFVIANSLVLAAYFIINHIIVSLNTQSKKNAINVSAILLNSFLYFGLNIWMLYKFTKYSGLFSAAFAAFYLIAAFSAKARKMPIHFSTYITLCFGYLSLAVPLQLDLAWVTASWSIITLILVILSFKLEEDILRMASSALGIITLGRLIFYDAWHLNPIDLQNPFNSTRIMVFIIAIAVSYIIASIYYKNRELFENYESYMIYVTGAYAIIATALTTFVLWIEIWDTSMAINAKKLWSSLAFIFQSIIMTMLGFMKKIKLFRLLGLALLGLSIIKVFFYDLSNLETGYRIISFIVLGVIALAGGFMYNKYKDVILK